MSGFVCSCQTRLAECSDIYIYKHSCIEKIISCLSLGGFYRSIKRTWGQAPGSINVLSHRSTSHLILSGQFKSACTTSPIDFFSGENSSQSKYEELCERSTIFLTWCVVMSTSHFLISVQFQAWSKQTLLLNLDFASPKNHLVSKGVFKWRPISVYRSIPERALTVGGKLLLVLFLFKIVSEINSSRSRTWGKIYSEFILCKCIYFSDTLININKCSAA